MLHIFEDNNIIFFGPGMRPVVKSDLGIRINSMALALGARLLLSVGIRRSRRVFIDYFLQLYLSGTLLVFRRFLSGLSFNLARVPRSLP